MDVLAGWDGDRKITWYENLDGRRNFGQQQTVSRAVGYFNAPSGLLIAANTGQRQSTAAALEVPPLFLVRP